MKNTPTGSREKSLRGRSKKRSAYSLALERVRECRAMLQELIDLGIVEVAEEDSGPKKPRGKRIRHA